MQELEKILEEIEKEAICIGSYYVSEKFRDAEDLYVPLSDAKDVIRKHMTDGWIPVEERSPEAPEMEDEYPEFNVMIEGAKIPTTLQYSHEGIWVDDYGNAYNVIAWQPLPEPYRPESKTSEEMQEWKDRMLRDFMRKSER